MAPLATVFPLMRAAVRERLLTVIDIDHSPGSVTATAGVYARTSGSWIDAGFAIGQEVAITGMGVADGTVIVTGVAALSLTTSGTASASGNAPRFVVGLPFGRAWEGAEPYQPGAAPFVAETFSPLSTRKRGAGQGGIIEHLTNANFTLFYPARRGALAIERMAGAVMAHFAPGLSLQRAELTARVSDVSRSGLTLDGEWLACGVSISLTAYTT